MSLRRKDLRRTNRDNRRIFRETKRKRPVSKSRRTGKRFNWTDNEKRWLWLIAGLIMGFIIFGFLGGVVNRYAPQLAERFPRFAELFSIEDGLDFMLPIIGFIVLGITGLATFLNRDTIEKMTDDDPNT